MTQEFECTVPVIGHVYVTVEGDLGDKKAIIEAAIVEAYVLLDKNGINALEQYEISRVISQGNYWLSDSPSAVQVETTDGEDFQAEMGY